MMFERDQQTIRTEIQGHWVIVVVHGSKATMTAESPAKTTLEELRKCYEWFVTNQHLYNLEGIN